MPEFKINEIEDAFAYYVYIIGISEDVFWNSDIWALERIAKNKIAYDNWKSYQKNKAMERAKHGR